MWKPLVKAEKYDALKTQYTEALPHLPLAREIGKRTAGMAMNGPDREKAIAAIQREELARRVLLSFDALPEDQRYAIIAEIYGDDDLKALLEQRRAAAATHAAFASKIGAVVEEAERLDSIDLRSLPERAILGVRLYDIPIAGQENNFALVRESLFMAEGDRTFTVMADVMADGNQRPAPAFRSHENVELGIINRSTSTSEPLDPFIVHGGELAVAVGNNDPAALGYENASRYKCRLLVGELLLNDQLIWQ
jgi:hypothetical protein